MELNNTLFLRLTISFLLFVVLFFMGIPIEIMAVMILFLGAIILFRDRFNEKVSSAVSKFVPEFPSWPSWGQDLFLLLALIASVLIIKALLFALLKMVGFDYYASYNAWYAKAVNATAS